MVFELKTSANGKEIRLARCILFLLSAWSKITRAGYNLLDNGQETMKHIII